MRRRGGEEGHLLWRRHPFPPPILQRQPDEARLAKIIGALGIEAAVPRRDLASKDGRTRLQVRWAIGGEGMKGPPSTCCPSPGQAVARAWLPLSAAVLGAVVRVIPSPVEAQARKRGMGGRHAQALERSSYCHACFPACLPASHQAKRVDRLWPELLSALPAALTSAAAASASATSSVAAPLAPLSPSMTLSERLARVRRGIATCDTSADAE